MCLVIHINKVHYCECGRQKQWTDCSNFFNCRAAIKETLECGRTSNAKAAYVVGGVLALRLKVEGLHEGHGRGIHLNVNMEIEKKGFKSRTKVWAVVNALRSYGVKLILDDDYHDASNSWSSN